MFVLSAGEVCTVNEVNGLFLVVLDCVENLCTYIFYKYK
jgi:hypothetical protein